jgi:hypothetical protein
MTTQPLPLEYQYETALIAEECGEVTQIVGKALRYGWDSYDPANPTVSNLDLFHYEVGDVLAAVEFATARGLLDPAKLAEHQKAKVKKLNAIAPAQASVSITPQWSSNTSKPTTIDQGLTAAQEKSAAVVGIIFAMVIVAATWFGSGWIHGEKVRLEASRAATACYQEALTTNVNASTCESLQRLSGVTPTVTAPVPPAE